MTGANDRPRDAEDDSMADEVSPAPGAPTRRFDLESRNVDDPMSAVRRILS